MDKIGFLNYGIAHYLFLNIYSVYFRDYKKDHKFKINFENLYYVNTNNMQITQGFLSK